MLLISEREYSFCKTKEKYWSIFIASSCDLANPRTRSLSKKKHKYKESFNLVKYVMKRGTIEE